MTQIYIYKLNEYNGLKITGLSFSIHSCLRQLTMMLLNKNMKLFTWLHNEKNKPLIGMHKH